MSHRSLVTRLALAAMLAWTTLGAGCASERDPIDRVQPNALPKSFFVGKDLKDASDDPEFYWRNYVVDASASQSLVGVGEWGHVDRIRWEITEDQLIARKAYQIADGEDDKGSRFAKTPNGTIVAAYKIQSHFDTATRSSSTRRTIRRRSRWSRSAAGSSTSRRTSARRS